MSKTITFGPVTRIEGHLDIEVALDAVNGVQQVVDARVCGTMFRGFEMILGGKHPRDAIPITQRICGVCPTSHAMAASMTLEAAYGSRATPPPDGRILRNLILAADFLQSHILHFYHLALLDYVDSAGVVGMSPAQRYAAADLISGPEASGLLAHYVKAMDIRRKTHQIGAIFGGKMPCTPVFVAGGCTQTLTDTLDLATAGEPKASERIAQFGKLLGEVRGFIERAYLPDVRFLMRRFPAYSKIGRGCGNLLAFGAFDLDEGGEKKLFPRGVSTDKQDGALDVEQIGEHVTHSRYRDAGAVYPGRGATEPEADKAGAYSWIKAPRYGDRAHEVGPLARTWIAGLYRRGPSVMDRLMARALETRQLAAAMAGWLEELSIESPTSVDFRHPTSGSGIGLTEAPRGALAHWTQFEENAIGRYQVVTPTAWNGSPRDAAGQPGPLEQALIGTPVRDKDAPTELLRVVHSFDPCLACSVH